MAEDKTKEVIDVTENTAKEDSKTEGIYNEDELISILNSLKDSVNDIHKKLIEMGEERRKDTKEEKVKEEVKEEPVKEEPVKENKEKTEDDYDIEKVKRLLFN